MFIRLHVDNIVSLKAREDVTLITPVAVDDTPSVKFADDVPPMSTDDVALDLDISEHSEASATITRPGSRPTVPKQGTVAFLDVSNSTVVCMLVLTSVQGSPDSLCLQ